MLDKIDDTLKTIVLAEADKLKQDPPDRFDKICTIGFWLGFALLMLV